MIRSDSRFSSRVFVVGAVSIAILVGACIGDPSAPPQNESPGVSFGKAAAGISVGSVKPDSATQDTTLDVVINGSGFVLGAEASWAFAGVEDPGQVRTNSTRYVSSRQLVANITISATATIGSWDVIVRAGSKGGIGTEAFTIKPGGKPLPNSAPDFYLSNDAGNALQGDGVSAYLAQEGSPFAGMSRYSNGDCGTTTTIFDSPSYSGSGDAVIATADFVDKKCRYYPRKIRLSYAVINPDGSITAEGSVSVGSYFNIAQIHTASSVVSPVFIPIGDTVLRGMNFYDYGKCGTLRFRPVLRDGRVTGADEIAVTRTAADTWVVATLPDEVDLATGRTIHRDKAWCESSGKLYHVPVRIVLHTSTPLTP